MSSYTIGKQIFLTVTVTDKASALAVDPAAFTFTLKPPVDGGYATSTYVWNGTTWTNSESILATPSRQALGTFRLAIIIPMVNAAQGSWAADWKHTANGQGLGEGGDSATFTATPSPAR